MAKPPASTVDLVVSLVMASPGEITLVPTGPLTNVALALRREPRLASAVREVVLMGGSYTRGNETPAAEFNVFVDPEAAAIVFASGVSVTMIGLNLTHQARATREVLERVRALVPVEPRQVRDEHLDHEDAAWRQRLRHVREAASLVILCK